MKSISFSLLASAAVHAMAISVNNGNKTAADISAEIRSDVSQCDDLFPVKENVQGWDDGMTWHPSLSEFDHGMCERYKRMCSIKTCIEHQEDNGHNKAHCGNDMQIGQQTMQLLANCCATCNKVLKENSCYQKMTNNEKTLFEQKCKKEPNQASEEPDQASNDQPEDVSKCSPKDHKKCEEKFAGCGSRTEMLCNYDAKCEYKENKCQDKDAADKSKMPGMHQGAGQHDQGQQGRANDQADDMGSKPNGQDCTATAVSECASKNCVNGKCVAAPVLGVNAGPHTTGGVYPTVPLVNAIATHDTSSCASAIECPSGKQNNDNMCQGFDCDVAKCCSDIVAGELDVPATTWGH